MIQACCWTSPQIASTPALRLPGATVQERLHRGRRRVTLQDAMSYDEPEVVLPLFENCWAKLCCSNSAAEAETVFREDLVAHHPRNPRSLFGLWQALAAQKKTSAAEFGARPISRGMETS